MLWRDPAANRFLLPEPRLSCQSEWLMTLRGRNNNNNNNLLSMNNNIVQLHWFYQSYSVNKLNNINCKVKNNKLKGIITIL